MGQRKSWFTNWWGLLIAIVLLIIIGILVVWAIAGIANSGFGMWFVIGLSVIFLMVIVGAIFSEGFRSFLLRIFGRRRR